MNANELKNQAAQAKRTSTAISSLSKRLALSEADRQALKKAATILTTASNQVKSEAKSAKRTEDARNKSIAAATVEVKKIIATWPIDTIADKLTIILASGSYSGQLLQIYVDEKDAAELSWYLNTMVTNAVNAIIDEAAYRAIVDRKPVANVMEHARQQYDKKKADVKVLNLVKQWDTKMQIMV